jgi:hypothetical protein
MSTSMHDPILDFEMGEITVKSLCDEFHGEFKPWSQDTILVHPSVDESMQKGMCHTICGIYLAQNLFKQSEASNQADRLAGLELRRLFLESNARSFTEFLQPGNDFSVAFTASRYARTQHTGKFISRFRERYLPDLDLEGKVRLREHTVEIYDKQLLSALVDDFLTFDHQVVCRAPDEIRTFCANVLIDHSFQMWSFYKHAVCVVFRDDAIKFLDPNEGQAIFRGSERSRAFAEFAGQYVDHFADPDMHGYPLVASVFR